MLKKKYIAVCLGALLLLGFAITASAEKAIHVQWVCDYCGSRISSVRMPSPGTCSRNPYGKTHSWRAERYY